MRLLDATVEDAERMERFGTEVLPPHYTPIIGADAANAELAWWRSERMAEPNASVT